MAASWSLSLPLLGGMGNRDSARFLNAAAPLAGNPVNFPDRDLGPATTQFRLFVEWHSGTIGNG
jgi:hypothetical protein